MINLKKLNVGYWFIIGIVISSIGVSIYFISSLSFFGALIFYFGGIISFIYVPSNFLLKKTSNNIFGKITYLYANQLVNDQQKSILVKTARYVGIVALSNAILGSMFIISSLSMFFYNNIVQSALTSIPLVNIPIAVIRTGFVLGFGYILFFMPVIFNIRLEIIYNYIFIYGLALVLIGMSLLFYNEKTRRINLITSTMLAIFSPIGIVFSLIELNLLTRQETYILYEKTPKKIIPKDIIDSNILGPESKEVTLVNLSKSKNTINAVLIINLLTVLIYLSIGINYIFGQDKYIPSIFSFNIISVPAIIIGLCINGICLVLIVENYTFYKQKALLKNKALILSLIQMLMIPSLISINTNFITSLVLLIMYPFAVLSSILMMQIKKCSTS